MAVNARRLKEERPSEVALRDERVALSWAQVDETVNRITNALAAMDFGPRRRIAVMAENSAEVILLHVGAIHAGVSMTSLNHHLTSDEAAYIIEDSESQVVFLGPENVSTGIAAARGGGARTVVAWRSAGATETCWERWLDESSAVEPPHDVQSVPNVLYTSGTTGRPKAVVTPPHLFYPGTVEECIARLADFRYFMQQGQHLVSGPLYHTGPLVAVRVLAVGKPVAVMSHFDPEEMLRMIDVHRVETTLAVPTHFSRLLALPEHVRARYDVSSLQLVVHTGAACPAEVKRRMIEWWGPVFVEAYGGTEVGTVCKIESDEWLHHPGSIGRVQEPFSRAVVVDEDGNELPPNAEGRLYFEDPTGRGVVYDGDPEKTSQANLRPGVFTLGDVGFVNDEGYVYVTDRFSDLIISGGVNIYPAEAEQVLVAHPAVADVAVIGVPDAAMGEAVLALVVCQPDVDQPKEEELIEFCRRHLSTYKCPRRVEFVETVGRSPLGKLDKRRIRAPYWNSSRTIGG